MRDWQDEDISNMFKTFCEPKDLRFQTRYDPPHAPKDGISVEAFQGCLGKAEHTAKLVSAELSPDLSRGKRSMSNLAS
jgi:hypothetical protein